MRPGLFALLSLLLASCEPSIFLRDENPAKFMACPADNIENQQKHSFLTMQVALADRKWGIESLRTKEYKIDARQCVNRVGKTGDILRRPNNDCISISFTVQTSGEVSARIIEGKSIGVDKEYLLPKWMDDLDNVFSNIRCFDEDHLKKWAQDGAGT